MNDPPPDERSTLGAWLAALAAAYFVLMVLHVWVVDDAFITLRQVQQLLAGNGFVWNPGERVQAYTHPLWALLLIPIFAVTHEGFWTLAVTCFAVSAIGLWWAVRSLARSDAPWRAAAFLLLLLPSKAFFDFTSSGLENCLTHGLVVATWALAWRWLEDPDRAPANERSRLLRLSFLVGAAYLNRADTLAFVAPALVLAAHRAIPTLRLGALRTIATGLAPVVAWTLWSLFYYGSIVPNTAVAKITGARLTAGECVQSGLLYAFDSLQRDPWTLGLALAAMAALFVQRNRIAAGAAIGITCYLGYTLVLGAAGTHMSGRFFSGVAFLAAFCLARALPVSPDACLKLLIAATFATLLVPSSPGRAVWQPASYPFLLTNFNMTIDTRSFANVEGAGILACTRGVPMPNHTWYKAGLEFAKGDERVHEGGLGGEGGQDAIGFSGFAAGTDRFLIDHMGLSDALLARLPMAAATRLDRPGHVKRTLPDGYFESCRTGENRIEDPDLHAYYDRLRIVIRGPLWSWERLSTIVAWNFGAYDHLLAAYAARHGLRAP
ncbi:MAG: hypothetical protein JNK78_14385 [Planctomycetes bacterium]|nr:hypothetical protein [Planctomycetota bacterium]